MPRGNDPDAAAELKARYNVTGNAEQLIQSNRASTNRFLAAATSQPVDEEATKELDWDKIDAPGDVVAAAVRGKYISYVWQDEDGVLHPAAVARPGAKNVVRETDQERADREEVERQVHVHRAIREATERAEAEKAEAIRKAEEKASKEANEQVAKATDEAQKPEKGKS